jgi:hypothetical protein
LDGETVRNFSAHLFASFLLSNVYNFIFFSVRYDPETTLSDRVEFENERVEFLTEIAALMAAKARLKLNTKKLYASDGRAVQELLKLATILNK